MAVSSYGEQMSPKNHKVYYIVLLGVNRWDLEDYFDEFKAQVLINSAAMDWDLIISGRDRTLD